MSKCWRSREVPGQGRNVVGFEVTHQALCHDQRVPRGITEAGEQFLPGRDVSEIERGTLEAAHGFFAAKQLLFFFEDCREVHLDPLQRWRQSHAIRARVQPRGEIDHCIRTLFDGRQDCVVDEVGSQRQRPISARPGHLAVNVFSPLAGKSSREGIAEESVGAVILQRTAERRPTRRVRNVADKRFVRCSWLRHGRILMRNVASAHGQVPLVAEGILNPGIAVAVRLVGGRK